MNPNLIVKKLTTIATQRLNWFPVTCGFSTYYLLHVIMHGIPFDDEKHWQIPFGAYVKVSDKRNLPILKLEESLMP